MNINKEHSPLWVKVTIWITIFAFVFAFIAVGFFQVIASMKDSKTNTAATQTTDAGSQINQINSQFQPQATSTEALVKNDPKNKDVIAELASLYSQWGTNLVQIQDATAQEQANQKFASALSYWEQAFKLAPQDKQIAGDYATALFQTGDSEGAVKIAKQVVKENPKYATVWFNLGIYLASADATNNKDEAINAFETAIKYDTDATQKKQAQTYIDELKKAK